MNIPKLSIVSGCVASVIAFSLILTQSELAHGQSKRPLTVEDNFKINSVSNPQVSPEGDWVAYTVRETFLEKDKSETRVWMVPVSGGDAIAMTGTGGSASSPKWSPDGKYLTFLASRNDGKTQVWGLNRNGGEAQQLTDVKQGVGGYSWSPDGSRLLLSIRDADPKDELDEKDKKPEPWVIDRLQFKRDNVGYLNDLQTHLYTYVPGEDDVKQITSGRYTESQASWSPDGKLVAFSSNRTRNPDANGNSDIWIVSTDNTDKGQTLVQLTINPGSDSSPVWSPDGSSIAYVTGIEPDIIWYAVNKLAVIPSTGGEPKLLTTKLDRNVSSPRWSPQGGHVFFLVEDSGERHLANVDVNNGTLTRLVSGFLSVRSYSMNDLGITAALIGKVHMPGEIFKVGQNGTEQLTKVNDDFLSEINLAEVENAHFNSKDGTEIEGFIYKPVGFNESFQYPSLLRIHGGPVSQYEARWNFEAQLFAANGYVVITVNPRGSSGYGQDFSYALFQDWGNKDYEDVMAGVDYAIEKGYSDPDRLGVGGWSYGGILTNYVITKSDRFKGAISGASEVLYVANYGHDHYQYQWEKELGLPWENRDLWEKLSPFNYVENIVTPTLIMGGEQDWNVPILNSEQLYQALKRLGITTQLVVYPGEHHGIRKLTFQKDRYERYLAWYEKFVKNAVLKR